MSGCRVEQDLSEHNYKQDKLEKEWNMNLEDKKDELVDAIINVINKNNDDLFLLCFGDQFNLSYADENDFLNDLLENLDNEDYYSERLIVLAATKLAYYLFACEPDEIFEHKEDLIQSVIEAL